MTKDNTQNVFNEDEAARYLGLPSSTLRMSRSKGYKGSIFPPFLKIGRSVRYLKTDLDQWLNSHRVECKKHEPIQNR